MSPSGGVDAARLDLIEILKVKAQEAGQPQILSMDQRKALIQASGWGTYRYWLRCGDFDVFVGRGRSMPAAYARIASEFIHEVGPLKALADLRSFVEALLDRAGEATCSRVDIYADFQGWVPGSEDYQHFITRSRRNTSHIALHHYGRRFTGFTFGRDAWSQGSMTRAWRSPTRASAGCTRSGVPDLMCPCVAAGVPASPRNPGRMLADLA
jgi:hypothetical protein